MGIFMNDKRQLLCTFSTCDLYKDTIERLKDFYDVINNKFFVFVNGIDPNVVYITYNIIAGHSSKYPNTISVHRKKQTNTIYTLNAMNQIIKDENGGNFNKEFSVKWELYKDSLILTGEVSLRIIPIKILVIIS